MVDNRLEVEEFASIYVEYSETESESLEWSAQEMIDLWLEGEWDRIWNILQSAASLPRDVSTNALSYIAAGPLEDLLSHRGSEYIDRILALADSSPRFAQMLTGVWKSDIDPEVWSRVVQFCRNVPNPIDGEYGY